VFLVCPTQIAILLVTCACDLGGHQPCYGLWLRLLESDEASFHPEGPTDGWLAHLLLLGTLGGELDKLDWRDLPIHLMGHGVYLVYGVRGGSLNRAITSLSVPSVPDYRS
jgi:hypothetical protein